MIMEYNLDIELKNIIVRIVHEFSNINITIEDIKDDTNLLVDLGFHSLSTVKLIVEIEQLIGKCLDEDDVNTDLVKRYGNVRSCIEKYVHSDNATI